MLDHNSASLRYLLLVRQVSLGKSISSRRTRGRSGDSAESQTLATALPFTPLTHTLSAAETPNEMLPAPVVSVRV
jgi:hypothetical protein